MATTTLTLNEAPQEPSGTAKEFYESVPPDKRIKDRFTINKRAFSSPNRRLAQDGAV